jgi:osmotically-inducible protein OsmY
VNIATVEDDPAGLVRARLRRSGYPVLLGIHCEMREGVLVLVGTVPTFHLKQIAQELAAHTRGVWKVENRLLVTSSAGPKMARLIDEAGSVP